MKIINPYRFGGADSLLTDLVSWWSLDETSGTRVDSHGSNDLTDINTVTYDTGKQGNAAYFNPTNDEYLTRAAGHGLLASGRDITIAAWCTIVSKAAPRYIACVAQSNAAVFTNVEWAFYYNSSGDRFTFDVPTSGTTNPVVADNFGSPSLNTWYLVMASYEHSTGELSISVNNGTPDTASGAVAQNVNVEFYMGKLANLSQRWYGRLDEVAFWGRLLTADEKARLYNSGSGMAYPG